MQRSSITLLSPVQTGGGPSTLAVPSAKSTARPGLTAAPRLHRLEVVPSGKGVKDTETGMPAEESTPARRVQVVELLVFCFLVVPSLTASFLVAGSRVAAFPTVAVAIMVRDAALVAIILYFLWRNGERRSRLGWRWRHVVRELALGCALFVPFRFVVPFAEQAFIASGLTVPSRPPAFLIPHGTAQLVLATVLVVVVAFSEETIFRGYLMLRLKTATRSTAGAVLLSAAIFSVGHGYEGSAGVATVGVIGIILALVYVWRGSLVAPMVLHFLEDFFSLVVAPQLPH